VRVGVIACESGIGNLPGAALGRLLDERESSRIIPLLLCAGNGRRANQKPKRAASEQFGDRSSHRS
jgi:hypothetical protein